MKPSLEYSPFLMVTDLELVRQELKKKQNPDCKHPYFSPTSNKCEVCGRTMLEIIAEDRR